MGDRTYVHFNLCGRIETIEALNKLCTAMAAQWMLPDNDCGGGPEMVAEDIKASFADAAAADPVPAELGFYAEDVNYANIDGIEAVCQKHGIAYWFSWEPGGGYGPGQAAWRPGEAREEAETIGDEIAVSLTALQIAVHEPDPLAAVHALVAKAARASSIDMPGFSVSDVVAAHLKAWASAVEDRENAEIVLAGVVA